MYEIEFSSDRWVKERKERLYYKKHNIRRHRQRRYCSLAVFFIFLVIGLWAVGQWPVLPLNDRVASLRTLFMTIVALCASICIFSLFIFFNTIGQLFTHLPGTKLDYEGPIRRDTYRVSFDDSGFTVWENGVRRRYKYVDIHHTYKDKQGLLLADIDLYIPLEAVEPGLRSQLLRKFYR